MHDITDLEGRGIPGVGVASTEFEAAAAAQRQALGYDAAVVFVPHPIQDRSDDVLSRQYLSRCRHRRKPQSSQ